MSKENSKSKKIIIRNSTAEFMMFTSDAKENGIEVRFEDENLWLNQKLIAELFKTTIPNINTYLKSIFDNQELEENSVTKDFLITAMAGKKYNT
ncbi:MAG: cell filamentation protein Fic, partial [bacterium]